MNETEKAWLAGFIDGEGYFGLSKKKDKRKGEDYYNYGACLAIANTDKSVMQEVERLIGGKTALYLRERQNPKHKRLYQYYLSNQKRLEETIKALLPYLRLKKRQAELLLEYVQRRQEKKNKKGYIHPYVYEDKCTYIQLKELNRRGNFPKQNNIAMTLAGEKVVEEMSE